MLLASRKVVSETESHVQLYPASDVQKMFTILNLPVPDFILRAAQGEVCGHVTVTCYPYVTIVSILCMTCCSTMHSAECRLHLIGRTVPPHTTQIQLHTALLRASVYARGEALLLCVHSKFGSFVYVQYLDLKPLAALHVLAYENLTPHT